MKRSGFTQMSFQIRDDVAADFKTACDAIGVPASAVVTAFMSMVSSKAKARRLRLPLRLSDDDDIQLKHLQIVLDRAKRVEDVQDLVHTVLRGGYPLTWESQIGPDADHTDELRDAVEKRLAELHGGSDHDTAAKKKRG